MKPLPAKTDITPDSPSSVRASEPADTLSHTLDEHRAKLCEHFPLPDLEQLSQESSKRAIRRKHRAVLGGLGILIITGALWGLDPAYRSEHFETAIGSQRKVSLTDGSILTLDTNTHLNISWHLRSRRATIDRGRVLFQVEHQPLRPFEVQAGRAQVQVTGTRFEVEHQADDIAIYLDQGSVNVDLSSHLPHESGHYQLQPGMTLTLGRQSPAQIQQTPQVVPLAWAHGELVFNSTRLDEALARLQRYVPQPIQLADPSLASIRVSGVFRTEQAQSMFDLLPLVGPITVRHGKTGSIVVERKPRDASSLHLK